MIVRRRKLPSGATRWEMDYTLGGRRSRKTVPGTDGRTLKKEAEALARAWFEREASRAAGLAAAEPMTLGELLERDRGRPDASEATRKLSEERSAPLERLLGSGTQCSSLNGADMERYKQARLGEGASARTVNLEVAHVLGPALRRAAEDGLLHPDALPKIRRLPETKKRIRWLTGEEVEALAEAAATGANGKIASRESAAAAILFLANTGLRRGEFMGSRDGSEPGFAWRQVDWERRVLAIPCRKRGGGLVVETRLVPLNAVALAVLRKQGPANASPEAPVFRYQQRLRNWLKLAGAAAGLARADEITPHSLRHTFATLALQRGANIRDVAALLGNTVEVTARVYLHESETGMRTAAESLNLGGRGAYLEHEARKG